MCISEQAMKELRLLNMKMLMVETHLSIFAEKLGVQYPIVKVVQPSSDVRDRKSDTNQAS